MHGHGQPNVCNGMHETKYCSSSGSCHRYMSNPGKEHWRAVKWILRYLKRSSDMTLCYDGTDVQLLGYVDSDFVGNVK